VKAIGEMPRIRPPEPAFTTPPDYQRTTYQQGTYGRSAPHPGVTQPVPAPPPPLQSRTGKALKWAVSALLIAALGLGSWQLADALLEQDKQSDDTNQTQTTDGDDKSADKPKPAKPLGIEGAQEYVAEGEAQHPGDVGLTYDSSTTTGWRTNSYTDGPKIVIKPGVGIVYDLGSDQEVSAATLSLRYGGDHTTVKLYATDSPDSSTPLSSMKELGETTTNSTSAKVTVGKPVKSRYVLVWLTAMPYSGQDSVNYSQPGYKQAITDIKILG
jgi:hypothetical protein